MIIKASEGQGDLPVQVRDGLSKLRHRFGLGPEELALIIVISKQELYAAKGKRIQALYPVSTSRCGPGNREGSNQTPLGTHRVREKIGDGAPPGAVFRGRVKTGEMARIDRDPIDRDEDLVTTRILWLEGQEDGINRGGQIDSYRRYIYIHGTPEEGFIGVPRSHGCIRMKNGEVIQLFDMVRVGTLVEIRH